MKAPAFDYHAAETVEDAVGQLAEAGDDGLILAGGQTLVPMLAMRLARPSVLIDINAVSELAGIEQLDDGIRIKTCTRQNVALNSQLIGESIPLLAKALPFIGHHQTRNRGTIGGSIAHGDPAAEIPLIAVALDASIKLQTKNDTRNLSAKDFYEGPMMTLRKDDECLTDVTFPIWQEEGKLGVGFQEVSQRHGDFAIVSVAVQMVLDGNNVCQRVAIAVGGAAGIPVRLEKVEANLTGSVINQETIGDALTNMADFLDPVEDQHGSAAYRRRVARVMTERAIWEAAA